LVWFQEAALSHALSFAAVQRVVYSTCSVHRRENEDVVARCLAAARDSGWALEKALPTWPRRGVSGTALSDEEGEREAGAGWKAGWESRECPLLRFACELGTMRQWRQAPH